MKTQTFQQNILRTLCAAAVLAFLSAMCPSALAQTNTQLIAWWNFDDASNPTQTVDKVKGYVGVLTNSPTYTTNAGGHTGLLGDRGLNMGNNQANRGVHSFDVLPALNAAAGADQVCVTFWMRWNVAIANSSAFWFTSPSSTAPGRGYQAHCPYGGQIYFDTAGCCTVPTQRLNGTPAGVNWQQWHLFAFVKNGTTKQVWIDGTVVLQSTGANPLPTDFSDVIFGTGLAGTINNVEAVLDDFCIWQGSLTTNIIFALLSGFAPDKAVEAGGDNDGDGMPNWWEDKYGFNKNDSSDAAQDADNDGLTNLQEFQKGTDPRNPDTDGDGLKDGVETGTGIWVSPTNTGTNPLNPDTDGDFLLDGVETGTGVYVSPTNTGTDPNKKDTDGDGYMDSTEIALGTDPNNASSIPNLGTGSRIVAYWNFDDNSNTNQTVDTVHSSVGYLINGATYGAGHTIKTNDHSAYFGNNSAQRMIRSTNVAPYLAAAASGDKMTVSFWQKWATPPVANSAFWMVSPSSANGSRGFQAHVPYSDNQIYFDTGGTAAGTQRLNGAPTGINWQKWHHFAFVKNGPTKEIWIDGSMWLDTVGANPLAIDMSELFIGIDASNFGNQFRGWIDDFAVYANALSQQQIQALAFGISPTNVDNATGDSDGDGMPDWWEDLYGFNKNNPADASQDADGDGLTNLQEYQRHTDPRNPDTDGDGLNDSVETNTGTWNGPNDTGTDPLNPDTDGDGLLDGVETNTGVYVSPTNTGTNPLMADTDYDFFPDGIEVLLGSNPLNASSTPITPGAPNLLSYWDFNNATAPTQVVDSVHSFVGAFEGGAAYTDIDGGRSMGIGDRGIDMGLYGTGLVRVANAIWLNAAALGFPDAITVSFWQRWSVPYVGSFAFYGVSPSAAPNSNYRGISAHTPWSDGTIYYDTGGILAGTTRISANINTISNSVPGYVDAATFFTNTVWHHFAFTKNGNAKQIWIDGILFLEANNPTNLVTDFTEFLMGNGLSGVEGFRGVMDDFAVYGSALSSNQIAALALGASPTNFVVPPARPAITTAPVGQTVDPGANVTFTAAATSGTSPLLYQWKLNGKNIPGATSSTLTVSNVGAAQAGDYVVNASNPSGGTWSPAATLVVRTAPLITVPPQSVTTNLGSTVAFTVTAVGSGPLTYQWKQNGSDLADATNAVLTLLNVLAPQLGDYTVAVGNPFGTNLSASATLSIIGLAQPPKLSIRLSGANVVLSYPTADGAGYALNSASSLVKPITWQPATGTFGTNGDQTTLTIPLGTSPKFYILKK